MTVPSLSHLFDLTGRRVVVTGVFVPAYPAAKSAITGLTKVLANE